MTPGLKENKELLLAGEFVRNTGSHIFLTGKAGTGKTTFLHQLKNCMDKRMVITAPTGVAAINAGGVTLHSFFQLPFGPFIPGNRIHPGNREPLFKFSRDKKQTIQSLDLLVIDEISMVRADLLDSVDAALRLHRRNDEPFGGVQLLMIGDLYQLSPVARQEEWDLLQSYYESPYFFSSRALARTDLVTIELKHIYRQSDARFIRLLNQVRNNRLDAGAVKELNRRHIENFTPEKEAGYITMTTHNRRADMINQDRLAAVNETEYRFDADISGDFPGHMHPAPDSLRFRKSAQVMFLRNDHSPEKRYYNGKIGTISRISGRQIHVRCPDDPDDIVVEPVVWKNIRYQVNPETMEIQEENIGRFEQFPLKLAWAITIHKSQGLTFEKAVIDVRSAFAHGQVYVALSRCKSLDGLVLSAPVPAQGIESDGAVLDFIETVRKNPPSESRLREAVIRFRRHLLLACFDFQMIRNRLGYLARLIRENAGLIQISGISDMGGLQDMAGERIFIVGEKFIRQMRTAFTSQSLPGSDDYVRERTQKASRWFETQFSLVLSGLVQHFSVETDNKELGKKISNALNLLKQEIAVRLAGIKSCENGFSPSCYLRAISKARIDFTPQKVKKSPEPVYTESQVGHEKLFSRLKDWRARKAGEQNVTPFRILHQQVLIQIAIHLPVTADDLKKIRGVGEKTLEKYGDDLLEIVTAWQRTEKKQS